MSSEPAAWLRIRSHNYITTKQTNHRRSVVTDSVLHGGLRNKHLVFCSVKENYFTVSQTLIVLSIWRHPSETLQLAPVWLSCDTRTPVQSNALFVYYCLSWKFLCLKGMRRLQHFIFFCLRGKQDFQILMKNKWLSAGAHHFPCTMINYCQEHKAKKQIFLL